MVVMLKTVHVSGSKFEDEKDLYNLLLMKVATKPSSVCHYYTCGLR